LIFSLGFCVVTNEFSNYIIQYLPSNLCSNFFKSSALKSIYLQKLYIIFYKLLIYFIYINLWCKSLWPGRDVECLSTYVVCNPAITQEILQRPPQTLWKIVFDQTTSQVLWKEPRGLKECQQGCHFYKVTLKLYQN
jgi:hypothetical protein